MQKEPRIVQICEPVFLYLCRLNRLRAEGVGPQAGDMKYAAIHHNIESLFIEREKAAGATNQLQQQWKKIEPGLCFFVDWMIIEEIFAARQPEDAAYAVAQEWSEHSWAEERLGTANGGSEFFRLLREELDHPANDLEARDRLEFYHTCLSLGFTGQYLSDPRGLADLKGEVAGRLQHVLSAGDKCEFTPETGKHLILEKLTFDPAPVWWGVALITLVVVAFFFVATGLLYKSSAEDLTEAITYINTYGDEHDGLHK